MNTLSPFELAYCVGVMLLAYGLRGSTGFGGALGMPLLALVLPIKMLVPVWTLLGFASSVAILGRDRRHVARRDFVAFMPWCAGRHRGRALFLQVARRAHAGARPGRAGAGLRVLLADGALRPPARCALAAPRARPRGRRPFRRGGHAVRDSWAPCFSPCISKRGRWRKTPFRATMSAMLLMLSIATRHRLFRRGRVHARGAG